MVVPSTIAGGPSTNIKIRVELNRVSLRFVTSQGPHRACVCAKNILARELRYQSRVASVLPRNFSFLINPRRVSRAASSDSNFQTAAWAHLPHAAPQAPPYRTGRSLRSAYSPALTASNDSYVIRMMFYDTYLYLFASDSLPSMYVTVPSIVAELRVYQSVTNMTNVKKKKKKKN
jgi:hypothetical protein